MDISKQDLIKLPKWQKGLILLGFILLLGVLWYFLLFSPAQEQIVGLRGEIQKLQKDVQEQQKAKLAKHTLESQIKALQQEIKVLSSKLPEEKEIPALLSSVNEVGRTNGLDFALFKQEKAVRKDYYSEIPVQIQVEGGFQQIALFLQRVGLMDRILHVSKLKMGKYKALTGGGVVEATMEATTYKYESQPLPKKEDAKGKRPSPAASPSKKSGKGEID
jgi:type IV pilus assembly protein PilO